MLAPRSGRMPRQAVVLLHGYGADGRDLIGLGQHWGALMPDALFVAPDAPQRCADNPLGYQWFPLDLQRTISSVVAGAPAAREAILGFLRDLWTQTGLTAGDTFLVGFSQGGMMALHAGLSVGEPVLGIVSFSGALVPPEGFGQGHLPKPPVCLVHGDMDQVVDPRLSQEAAIALQAQGYDVTCYCSKGTAHGISPDGLDFATDFMMSLLDDANG